MQRGTGVAWAVWARQPVEVTSGETADLGPTSLLPAPVTLRQSTESGLASPAPRELPHTRLRRLWEQLLTKPSQGEGHRQGRKEPSGCHSAPGAPAAMSQQNCSLGYREVSIQPRKRPLGQHLELRRISCLTHRGSRAVVSWVLLDPSHRLETGLWALATCFPIL